MKDFLGLLDVVTPILALAVSFATNYFTKENKAQKTTDQILNIIRYVKNTQDIKTTDTKDKYSSVYGLMFARRMKEANSVSFTLFLFTIAYLLFSIFMDIPMNSLIVFIPIIMLFLVWIKLFISTYRVSNGYLGNSEYEIREFLNYIISEASDDDLNDGSGPRPLIDLKEFAIDKTRASVIGEIRANSNQSGVQS